MRVRVCMGDDQSEQLMDSESDSVETIDKRRNRDCDNSWTVACPCKVHASSPCFTSSKQRQNTEKQPLPLAAISCSIRPRLPPEAGLTSKQARVHRTTQTKCTESPRND